MHPTSPAAPEAGNSLSAITGLPYWILAIAYVATYMALDAISYVQPLLKLGITPWNPDAGLTLAFLLMVGWRQAPWTALAALLAELVVHGATAPLSAPVLGSMVIAIGYGTLAFALQHADVDFRLSSHRATLKFCFGVAVTALAVAAGYAGTFMMAGLLPRDSATDAIARFWVGDLNGILTLTPLLLAHASIRRNLSVLTTQGGLICLQTAALVVLLGVVFHTRPSNDLPLVYLLFVPVIWITLSWGVIGACAATLLIQIGLIIGAAPLLDAATVVEVQYFLITLVLTALLLGSVVAERANALRQVAASEAEQRALLAAAPDAVLATDPDGRVTSANRASQMLFGVTDGGIVGTALTRWFPKLGLHGSGEHRRTGGMRASGERFPAEVACVRLEAPAREGYLLIARDTTEGDLAQVQLRERDAALSRAMRFALAGELASALTHELNQPITAVVSYLGAVEMLADLRDKDDPRFVDTLHKASREALRASDMLKRMREFYRGGMAQVTQVNIQDLVVEMVSAIEDRAVQLGVEVRHDVRIGRKVLTDGVQLQMVLHNLLANALDAVEDVERDSRCIELCASVVGGASGDRLCVSIEDTGRGIQAGVQESLFEPFVTSKRDGMGLGLALSRSLIRSQGGDLRLINSSGTGACFLVELPVGPVAELTE